MPATLARPRRICVCLEFLSDDHRRTIREAAQRCGFEVDLFERENDPGLLSCLAQSEVLFAHSPELLRRAPSTLRWYCCSYAGVDPYCADPRFRPPRSAPCQPPSHVPAASASASSFFPTTIAEPFARRPSAVALRLTSLSAKTTPACSPAWPSPRSSLPTRPSCCAGLPRPCAGTAVPTPAWTPTAPTRPSSPTPTACSATRRVPTTRPSASTWSWPCSCCCAVCPSTSASRKLVAGSAICRCVRSARCVSRCWGPATSAPPLQRRPWRWGPGVSWV